MHRAIRRLLTTTLGVPVALGALVATAPGALADVATFAGGFTTYCDLPVEPGTGSRVSGPYYCTHTAYSLGCGVVIEADPAHVGADTCRADLISGHTDGAATANPGYGYTCENGGGYGIFEYAPESGGPSVQFGVWLDVVGATIFINGSGFDYNSGRVIVVRATIPAHCTDGIGSPAGYQGTITPV